MKRQHRRLGITSPFVVTQYHRLYHADKAKTKRPPFPHNIPGRVHYMTSTKLQLHAVLIHLNVEHVARTFFQNWSLFTTNDTQCRKCHANDFAFISWHSLTALFLTLSIPFISSKLHRCTVRGNVYVNGNYSIYLLQSRFVNWQRIFQIQICTKTCKTFSSLLLLLYFASASQGKVSRDPDNCLLVSLLTVTKSWCRAAPPTEGRICYSTGRTCLSITRENLPRACLRAAARWLRSSLNVCEQRRRDARWRFRVSLSFGNRSVGAQNQRHGDVVDSPTENPRSAV